MEKRLINKWIAPICFRLKFRCLVEVVKVKGPSPAWILRHTKAVLYEPDGNSTYINKYGRASLLSSVEYLIEHINYLNKIKTGYPY